MDDIEFNRVHEKAVKKVLSMERVEAERGLASGYEGDNDAGSLIKTGILAVKAGVRLSDFDLVVEGLVYIDKAHLLLTGVRFLDKGGYLNGKYKVKAG